MKVSTDSFTYNDYLWYLTPTNKEGLQYSLYSCYHVCMGSTVWISV